MIIVCMFTERRLVQKSGSKDVQVHFPDGRKEDVTDAVTLNRFHDVREFLLGVERVWESEIGRFPLSFAISRETASSPRNTCSEARVPLATRNSSQSLMTQRSAPATVGPRAKVSLESSKGFSDGMRFKMDWCKGNLSDFISFHDQPANSPDLNPMDYTV
ncbi:unnamed protein product [Heligmosomoides polygyrus]|uniref:Polo_box_3 domain-containing protein n=1 Tax=Heligmosomoides polygyrus TaxID=6339 RepID=A0A183FKK6_HELPZ|nr:unnamed protein product [Heligmosomoides polygyrus]